jgi:hypothetical protein
MAIFAYVQPVWAGTEMVKSDWNETVTPQL